MYMCALLLIIIIIIITRYSTNIYRDRCCHLANNTDVILAAVSFKNSWLWSVIWIATIM